MAENNRLPVPWQAAVPLDNTQAGTIVEMSGCILTFILTLSLSGKVIDIKR